ncbi:hypothetical protein P170DRAFT_469485 [Aspergillus steynii IBT 23096]|uniref:RTA1 domain protein n=1 Tax=Aspergillus steynii IBT 23096 TaxID=1392250 RepID=A0A2I2GMA9_9EURO|nr:uncharacterized protein P170DRAFT_469485 [Aspergillus steynii IBT 23096]PLB54013.1 hypothetical protein P170DRAFT_469485 [Aspergillus steynii IBT 23096]
MTPTPTTSSTAAASATCIDVAPGKNGYLPPEACDALLFYEPSFAAAILFAVLFGLTTALHTVQAFVYKKRYAWVVIMGATWELLAFVFRVMQTRQQNKDIWGTLYELFFLLAPIWINAFIYMTLGRMIYYFLPDQKLAGISARRYGALFVSLDILAFLVQVAGASMSTNDSMGHKFVMLGLHLYMGGIGLQELFILCFLGLAIKLQRKVSREGYVAGDEDGKFPARQGLFHPSRLFYGIYFALAMITVRIMFRLCQYAQGYDATNPVLTTESYEYVLDAAPMFLALLALNVFHPGHVLRGPRSDFPRLTRAEKKELKRQKKERKMEMKRVDRGLYLENDG